MPQSRVVVSALLALGLTPSSVAAAYITDYTRGLFSLGGEIGVRMEDYRYSTDAASYGRRSLQQRVGLNAGGFVWDPRFLDVDAGVSLLKRETETDDGKSDYRTEEYHLTTTWFQHKRNPLVLFASRTSHLVDEFLYPTYEVDVENHGLRWGFGAGPLGDISLQYGRSDTSSTTEAVPRDDTREELRVEGRREFGGRSDERSELTYGYRRTDHRDDARGTAHEQDHVYAYSRNQLSERTSLSTNAAFYDRRDAWQTEGAVIAANEQESKLFTLSSGLNVQSSERLSQNYSLSLNRNDVGGNRSDSATLAASTNFELSERWRLHGNAHYSDSRSTGEAEYFNRSNGVGGGFRYNRRIGEFLVNAGYSLGLGRQENTRYEPQDVVQHAANAGYSRRLGGGVDDMLDYRVSVRDAFLDTREHNLRYVINKTLSPRSRLRTTLQYRHYEEDSPGIDRENRTRRGEVAWNRDFLGNNSFTLSMGRTESDNRTTTTRATYFDSRVGMTPARIPNLRLTGHAHIEDRSSSSAVTSVRNDLEANARYRFGRWNASLRYRQRSIDYEEDGIDDRQIMFDIRREFNARF